VLNCQLITHWCDFAKRQRTGDHIIFRNWYSSALCYVQLHSHW